MFVQPIDEPALVETGDNLEAMTSELKPSQFIDENVSGGQKYYVYKIVDSTTGERKTVCKFRGITLKYNASQKVNFKVIKNMILGKTETEQVTVHTEEKNKRKRKAGGVVVSIIIEPEDKLYSISFSRDGFYTTIRRCRLGINRRGLPPLNVILRSMFKLLSTSDDLIIKYPFSFTVSGPSGSGKSSFCIGSCRT